MKKIWILPLCIGMIFCSCVRDHIGPEDEFQGCPLSVICRDITLLQSDNPLNIWGGYCSFPTTIDADYLYGLDKGTGKVLPVISGYTLEYIDPEDQEVRGPVSVTAWYRPIKNDLRIEHKSLASGNIIHTSRIIESVPKGEIINKDYLSKQNYIPVLDEFEFEWIELNRMGETGENTITLWYNPLFTLTIHHLNYHKRGELDNEIAPPSVIPNVKRNTFIDLYYIRANGLTANRLPFFIFHTEGDGYITSDMDFIVWYGTGW